MPSVFRFYLSANSEKENRPAVVPNQSGGLGFSRSAAGLITARLEW